MVVSGGMRVVVDKDGFLAGLTRAAGR